MKIAIIGGGLAGLSVYLHLRKHLPNPESHSITILERTTSSSGTNLHDESERLFRGGLGIGPNGMRVLRRLDESLHAEVINTGFLADKFSFRTAGGWRLGTWNASTQWPTDEGMVMIDRAGLWKILKSRVPDDDIREGVSMETLDTDGHIRLAGGECMSFDLVVGADGVWSVARTSVIDKDEDGYKPLFSSLMTMGGSIPVSYLENLRGKDQPPVVMTFGSTGFIGYAPISSLASNNCRSSEAQASGQKAMWWANYTEDPRFASRQTVQFPMDPKLREDFKIRHSDWVDPTIQRLLSALCQESDVRSKDEDSAVTINLHAPTWIIPKLARWHRGRVVLLGDAAHALPTTTGQGASQALEDSAALALLVSEAAGCCDVSKGQVPEARLVEALDLYQTLRKPRVERLLDEARGLQNHERKMGVLRQLIMFTIMFVVFRLVGRRRDAWKLEYGIEEEIAKLRKLRTKS